ncbi:MAG TPA: peptidylprolyl isomerase [Terriglobales bacterium]|nr:peptidylprolyl isomerase [Terriglobales bacterium]
MFRQLVVCLLLAAFVSAQTAPPASPAPSGAPNAATPGKAPETPAAPTVNPDDPVITIKGYCSDASLTGDACKTVITKAQFEKIADTLQPGMSPAMRRQLATAYARMLAMSSAAEKRDLDKTPHFQEASQFARMQILSQELGKALQTDSSNVSDQDIQDYYQKNQSNFEQATFVRIFVPHTKRIEATVPPSTKKQKEAAAAAKSAPAVKKSKDAADQDDDDDAKKPASSAKTSAKKLSPEEQQKAGEEAMKKEAAALRKRLVAGEDPDKLEKAAFTAGGLPGTPPPTKMEKVRRTSLPPAHQSVMELKEGEVSEVISDPSGNYIYKMISKEQMPLDNVKTEIKNTISAQRYREAMQKYQNNADLNNDYFGTMRGPGMPMGPRGSRPPQGKPEDDDRD